MLGGHRRGGLRTAKGNQRKKKLRHSGLAPPMRVIPGDPKDRDGYPAVRFMQRGAGFKPFIGRHRWIPFTALRAAGDDTNGGAGWSRFPRFAVTSAESRPTVPLKPEVLA
jgi:hypothetical protein